VDKKAMTPATPTNRKTRIDPDRITDLHDREYMLRVRAASVVRAIAALDDRAEWVF
jgi:hypothetical protein